MEDVVSVLTLGVGPLAGYYASNNVTKLVEALQFQVPTAAQTNLYEGRINADAAADANRAGDNHGALHAQCRRSRHSGI